MANYAFATPAGQRSVKVTFQQQVLVSDGQGGNAVTYVDRVPSSWALVEPLSGREAIMAKQLTGVLLSALEIVYRSDLSITDRVKVPTPSGTRVLQLQSYQDPSGRRVELRIVAAEVQQ